MFVSVRGSRPGKNVQLTENEIRGLCLKSREIFLSQPIMLELEAPLKICGEGSFNVILVNTKHAVTVSRNGKQYSTISFVITNPVHMWNNHCTVSTDQNCQCKHKAAARVAQCKF